MKTLTIVFEDDDEADAFTKAASGQPVFDKFQDYVCALPDRIFTEEKTSAIVQGAMKCYKSTSDLELEQGVDMICDAIDEAKRV